MSNNDTDYQEFLAFKAAQPPDGKAAAPKRRTLNEIVHALVHSGNHVDLMDDADALVAPVEDTDKDAEKAPEEETTDA
jgi:hypothetical protein